MKGFGLYDSKDNLWMGTKDGPLSYDDYELARVAAAVMNAQFRYTNRIVVKENDGLPKVHKDNVDAAMTTLEAIKHLEDGGL